MNYTWNIHTLTEQDTQICQLLTKELKITPAAARMLVLRGITTPDEARRYIRPSLEDLHDPYLMRDMDKAVERLHRAILRGEHIMVYGDYDVDGTTAVALMYTFLCQLSTRVHFYIPDRYTEGYGISFKGIDEAQAQQCSLVIALDCGIKAIDKIEYANERHIDFIICDHHTPGDELPKAVAVLNMKRKDCPYPFKELSGCGVGFKLVQALARHRGISAERWYPLLSLLAMSIASDIVPVTGENRILAHYGLKQINSHPSIGLQSILRIAGLEGKQVTISDLVYKIGPRINASGRMHSGAEAVQLLIATDEEYARHKAEEINQYNTERREYDSQTTVEALKMLSEDPNNDQLHTTVVYSPHWHKGVVGIAASRLTETYYRPTIVFTKGDEDIISGSARSVGGFDLYAAIDSCRDLLTNFGGHQFAAGLSMHEADLPEFKRRFEAYVAEHILPEQMTPTIAIEQEIQFQDIDEQFFNILKHLEPFGPCNPKPIFCTTNVINHRYTKCVGKMGEHLKLDVTDRTAAIAGIAFNQGETALWLQNGNGIDLCYSLEENVYNGTTSIQMMVLDLKKRQTPNSNL